MFNKASMERIDRNAARLAQLIEVRRLAQFQARQDAIR
jgi:hypothetical protein